MRRRGLIIPFPRRRESPEAGDERELVEVYRCDQAEAVVVKGLLETGLKLFEGHQQHAENVAAALK